MITDSGKSKKALSIFKNYTPFTKKYNKFDAYPQIDRTAQKIKRMCRQNIMEKLLRSRNCIPSIRFSLVLCIFCYTSTVYSRAKMFLSPKCTNKRDLLCKFW